MAPPPLSDEPDISGIGQALDSLVHQFADPWAFLRELIQNSIDAGSSEIDVEIHYEEARGTAVIEVRDFGEGMSREIIDTRLTRLFSSSKEGDYTKIGQFGIGFVSVFAIEPELVCVDTGRAGEYWRVLFKSDRSFERIRLHDPVEGTTVRLFKQLDAAQVEHARGKAREVLERWCKHARADIRLDGESIARPMTLDGPVVVEHREDETHVVLAWVPERAGLRGYYHGGLTLHEEHDERLPYVAFKIDSRFLEHTLTRDNVLRDENYAKAMAIVERVAIGPLIDALFEQLERRLAEGADPSGSDMRQLYSWAERALLEHLHGKPSASASWQQRAVIPQLGSPPCSFADLRRLPRGKQIYCGRACSAIAERLRDQGHRLLMDEHDGLIANVAMHAAALDRKRLAALDSLCTALEHPQAAAWRPLCRALLALVARRFLVRAVEVGQLDFPGSPTTGRMLILQASFAELTPLAEATWLPIALTGQRILVLNAGHPTLVQLRELAERQPELAAYLTLKLILLHHHRSNNESETLALDHSLAGFAAEQRWRRLTA